MKDYKQSPSSHVFLLHDPLSRAGDFHARSRFARSTILEGKPQPRPQGAFPWENKGYS